MANKYLIILGVFCIVGLIYIAMVIVVGYLMPMKPAIEPAKTEIEVFPEGVIRYSEIGAGSDAILFLHGFNSQLSSWDSLWEDVDPCRRSIRLDIPGFGGSVWDVDSYDLASQSRRIYNFLLRRGVKKITIVGGSMGGSLGAKIAADYPKMVHALILVSPSGYTGSLQFWFPVKYFLNPGLLKHLAGYISNSYLFRKLYTNSAALQAITVTESYNDNWVRDLEKIQAATVLFWSLGDKAVPYRYANLISEKLSISKVITLPEEVGHHVGKIYASNIHKWACALSSEKKLSRQEKLDNISID